MRHLAQPIGAMLAVLLPGCYWLAEGGYVTRVPFEGAGGGSLSLRAGAGDPREDEPIAAGAVGLESELRLQVGEGFTRFALGGGMLWALWPGWEKDWSPFFRPTLRLPQVEWLPEGTTVSTSAGLELGAYFLRSAESNGRSMATVAFGGEYAVRGSVEPNAFFFGVTIGWGYSVSLTIPR